jgi:L-2-hydroxyglutarate oxidase LhgO
MQALYGCLEAGGGSVVRNTSVSDVRRLPGGQFELQLSSSGSEAAITTRNLFVAAGLGMADLGSRLPRAEGYQPPRLHFAKGHYFGLTGRVPFQRLVYPVPVEGGLGTHLTLDLQGRVRSGPDVKWVDEIDYSFDEADGALRARFEGDIRRYWPGLPEGALQPAYTGIRPKWSGRACA